MTKKTLKELLQAQKIIKEQIEIEIQKIKLIDEEIENKITEPIKQVRLLQGKDTGTISVMVENIEIKHDLPKKVVWDQGKLKQIVVKIKNAGDDPDKYTTVKYSVSEKQFKGFPSEIQAVFIQAREVKTGKAKITFKNRRGELKKCLI